LPNDQDLEAETLKTSTLPADLKAAGYDVVEIEPGERILAVPIKERMTLTSSGAYEPMIAGSTKPVAMVVSHADAAIRLHDVIVAGLPGCQIDSCCGAKKVDRVGFRAIGRQYCLIAAFRRRSMFCACFR
jgi:hypothetical protein